MFNADYEKRLGLGLATHTSSPITSPLCSPAKPSGPYSPSPQKYSDRFIPSRADNDWETRFALGLNSSKPKRKDGDSFLRLYPHVLENELLGGLTENVNRQGTQIGENRLPIPKRNLFGYVSSPKKNRTSHLSNSAMCSHSLSPISLASNKLLAYRQKRKHIQKTPFKVLDAPELSDDFYLNLLDWSSKDILSVGLGNSIYTFAAKTSQVSKLFEFPLNNSVTSVAYDENGNLLAVGTHDGYVQVWNMATDKVIAELEGHTSRVGAMAWSGHVLTTGGQDRRILLRDVRVPGYSPPVMKFNRHRQEVCGLRWAPGNLHLASGGNDNRLHIWDRRSSIPLQTYTEHNAAVKAMSWSPHHQNLLATGAGTADRCIRYYNTLLGRLMQSHDTGSQVCNLAWSKNSSQLVSTHGYSQNQIVVWQYPTMIREAELKGHTSRVCYLAVSPDGRVIVTGAGDETLRFWRVFTETPTFRGSKSVLELGGNLR